MGYLSDIRGFTLTIPYFYQWINYGDFTLNWFGQFMVDISIYLTLSLLILVIIQMRYQIIFRSIGLHSIYTPIPLIMISFLNENLHYYRRVRGVKRDPLQKNEEKKNELMDRLFDSTEMYKQGKSNVMLVIENKHRLFGFYHYYKIYLTEK